MSVIKFSDDQTQDELLKKINSKILKWDDDKYFADKEYVTNSMLSQLAKSPLHLVQYLNRDLEREKEKEHYKFGKAFHCSVLEAQDFDSRYFLIDDTEKVKELINGGAKNPRATNDYKSWKAEFVLKNDDKVELDMDSYNSILRMRDRIFDISEMRQMLENAQKEVVMHDEINGIKRKGKMDAVRHNDYVMDLKSMKDPANKFYNSFWNYGYDRQGSWYGDIAGVDTVIFLVVEKTAPFSLGIYRLMPETLEAGRQKQEVLLNEYNSLFIRKEMKDLNQYFIRRDI